MICRYPWTNRTTIEVFGEANFAGCHYTRKSTVGGVAMWCGQFVKAWSKTVGVLALSSGESELAAAVRAATDVVGLQSIQNDFCLCGHIAIKSGRNCSHWNGSLARIRKSPTFGCWRPVGATPCSFRENSSLQNVRTGESERCTDQVILGRNHCCATRKRVIGSLSLMMASLVMNAVGVVLC